MIEQGLVLRRFVLIATVLAGPRVLAQSPAPAKASVDADLADRQQVTLLPQTAIPANTRIELNLRGGDYEVRPSHSSHLGLTELRDPHNAQRPTAIHFEHQHNRALLKVDPPTGNGSPHVILELPQCADLSIRLSAGELVFTAPPCTHTDINLHAGELVAHLGPASDYATVHASTTIGEAKAEQFGQTKDGFFNAVNATATGPNTFAAHVFTGQITLKE